VIFCFYNSLHIQGSSEILAADQVIKQEATGGEQIIQVQMEGESDQNSAQVVQHHIVQLQSQDSLHQLQIANVPGQSIQLQDIISALQQGQAITVQDGNVLPAGAWLFRSLYSIWIL